MVITGLRAGALSLALAAGALPASAADYANPHLLKTAAGLAAVGETAPVTIDVRPAADYAKGHIPGARHLDPDAVSDPDSPIAGALRSEAALEALLAALGVSASKDVVLYDDKGGFHAARVFWLLEYLGHRRVSLLNGGIQSWTAAGHAVETGETGAPETGRSKSRYAATVTPRRYASADWILERRDDPETVVIDVRPAKAFAKGHIPWARSIPWKQNLNADLTMKSAEALTAHFESRGVTPAKNVVVHCQAGKASSHSYFALRLLGYPRVRTYHRSWSEWGAAEDLPKTTADAG